MTVTYPSGRSVSTQEAPLTPVPACRASLGMAEPAKMWMNAIQADATLTPSATTPQDPSRASANLATRETASVVYLESWRRPGASWSENTFSEQRGWQMHSGPAPRGCLSPSVMSTDTTCPPSAMAARATAGAWTATAVRWRARGPDPG